MSAEPPSAASSSSVPSSSGVSSSPVAAPVPSATPPAPPAAPTSSAPAAPTAAPARKKPEGNVVSVVAAIAANILVGIVKFIAAGISGSAAMVSEGVHSIVDSGNGFLVLLGLRRSKKPPTIEHPFGFGKELYFWTLVVSVSVFMLGGGVSVREGIGALQSAAAGTAEFGDPVLSYVVLIAAMVIEGTSLLVAARNFNKARGDKRPLEYIKDCKDPSLYTVLLEDSAAELGLVFALLGMVLGRAFDNHYFDGISALLIGLLLMSVSVVMLKESKGLLLGEGMTREELAVARGIVEGDPAVEKAGRILTMYFGPHSMLMTVDATFRQGCSGDEILRAVDRIERLLIERFPETTRIFIEAENLSSVERQREIQRSMPEE